MLVLVKIGTRASCTDYECGCVYSSVHASRSPQTLRKAHTHTRANAHPLPLPHTHSGVVYTRVVITALYKLLQLEGKRVPRGHAMLTLLSTFQGIGLIINMLDALACSVRYK